MAVFSLKISVKKAVFKTETKELPVKDSWDSVKMKMHHTKLVVLSDQNFPQVITIASLPSITDRTENSDILKTKRGDAHSNKCF